MRQYHVMTAHSREWEDLDTLGEAKAWAESYNWAQRDDAEMVLLFISEDGVVTEAYDIDNMSEPFTQYIGKRVEEV